MPSSFNTNTVNLAWNDPRFKSMITGMMNTAQQYQNDPTSIPQLGNDYWDRITGQSTEALAGKSATNRTQAMEQLQRQGLGGTGAAARTIADLGRGEASNLANMQRGLATSRQESELAGTKYANDYSNQVAGTLMRAIQGSSAAAASAGARNFANQQFDWRKKMDIFGLMSGMQGQQFGMNKGNFQAGANQFNQTQAMANGLGGGFGR